MSHPVKTKERRELQIELSAFADVAFLLIIFFILTTSLIRPKGKEIAIPSTEAPQEKKAEEKMPTVALVRDNIQFGDSEENMRDITLPELRVTLYRMELPAKADKDRMIVVTVGVDVPYQRYFEVVTAISTAGGVVALMEETEG